MNIFKELRQLRKHVENIPRNEYARLDITMQIKPIADRMDEIEKWLVKIDAGAEIEIMAGCQKKEANALRQLICRILAMLRGEDV